MAQTKSQKILRYALYSFVGAGVLGCVVFGSTNSFNSKYASAQSEQVSTQKTDDIFTPAEPSTFKSIVGPWYPVIFSLLSILAISVIVKVLRHPK